MANTGKGKKVTLRFSEDVVMCGSDLADDQNNIRRIYLAQYLLSPSCSQSKCESRGGFSWPCRHQCQPILRNGCTCHKEQPPSYEERLRPLEGLALRWWWFKREIVESRWKDYEDV
jgi:hypothetical protein